MPPPDFVLKCLGYPELRGPDGKVVRIRVKKHLALLTFLAIERRRYHDRERLVNLLWPTVSPQKGRHSIATAISLLRTIFGRGAFPTNRAAIRFTPSNLQLDLDRLEAGRVLGAEGEIDLDVDGFLRGFDIHDAPEFGLWKEREHARRLPVIHAGLLTLIDHGRRRGSHDEIMQRAERLLALDHLAEEGIRAKMEALALVGDRFSALRVFDEWKEQLGEELGAEPSMLVDGMAVQLRKRGWEPKEPNPVPAVPAEQWRERRFVGRKAEYRRLYETWEAVHQYRPQHFMVAGDSGVGKTTLAQRLVTAAGLEGASVSRVQCYQMEQRIPFGMIGALVAGLLGRPGVAATAPEALAEVARIVPQVKDHFRALPQPKQSEGESARLLFAEGVMDLLRAVMEERPLLLVVDDLHHADEASMAVLHLVMRRIVEGRFMVAFTTRFESELARHAQRIVDSSGELAITRLDLDSMPNDQSEELLGVILANHHLQPSPPQRRALVGASRGFPMVLELLAHDWVSNGDRCLALAFRAMTADLNAAPPVSDRFVNLVERLLAELNYPARQVLSLAAVLGQRLNDLPLYSILDLTVAQTLDGMAELAARRVLRDLGNGLEFLNELVRAHVYRMIPQPHRVVLHGAVADRLVARLVPDSQWASKLGLEAAWHLVRAHRKVQASDFLLQGSRRALIEGAPDEVVLSIKSSLPEIDRALQPDANALLVRGLHELGQWADGLEIASQFEDDRLRPIFQVLAIEARWHLGVLTAAEERAHISALIELATGHEPPLVRALTVAAFIAGRQRDEVQMHLVLKSLPSVHGLSGPEQAELLLATAHLAFYARKLDEGEQAVIHAKEVLTRIGASNSSAASAEIGLGVFRIARSDYATAAGHFGNAAEIARRIDNGQLLMTASANAALSFFRIGEWEKAVAHAQEVLPIAGPLALTVASYSKCASLAVLGREDEALRQIASGGEGITDQNWLRQNWLFQQADVFWLCGKRTRALCAASSAMAVSDRPLARGTTGSFARWATKLAAAGRFPARVLEERIQEAMSSRGHLDRLDEYEILSTVQSTGTKNSAFDSLNLSTEVERARRQLPAATLEILQRLAQ